MDHFFTNMELATKLLEDYKLTIIGTLKKNKKQIPLTFTNVKRPEHTSVRMKKLLLSLISHDVTRMYVDKSIYYAFFRHY